MNFIGLNQLSRTLQMFIILFFSDSITHKFSNIKHNLIRPGFLKLFSILSGLKSWKSTLFFHFIPFIVIRCLKFFKCSNLFHETQLLKTPQIFEFRFYQRHGNYQMLKHNIIRLCDLKVFTFSRLLGYSQIHSSIL